MPSFFDPAPVHPLFVDGPSGAQIAVQNLARPASLMDVPYTPPDPLGLMTPNPAGTNPKGTTPEGDGFAESQFSIPRANAILSDRDVEGLSSTEGRIASFLADPTGLMGVFSTLVSRVADPMAKDMAHSYLNSLMSYPNMNTLANQPSSFHSATNTDPANIGNQATRAAAEAMMGAAAAQQAASRRPSLPQGGVHGTPTPVGMPPGGVHGPF